MVRYTDPKGTTRMSRCECRRGVLPAVIARYGPATLDTLPAAVRKRSAAWPDRTLFICGPVGTGKTWAAIAVARQAPLLKFLWWPDWIARYRVIDNASPSEAIEQLDTLAVAPNLVIDDIGAENESDYGRRVLMRLFEARRDREFGTIITGNYDVGAVAERYDERLASRITESCTVIAMEGDDRRLPLRG